MTLEKHIQNPLGPNPVFIGTILFPEMCDIYLFKNSNNAEGKRE